MHHARDLLRWRVARYPQRLHYRLLRLRPDGELHCTPVVEGNLRNNSAGLYLLSAGTAVVRNNIIRGNRGQAIDITITSFAMNLFIIQNLVVENAGNGIAWSLVSGGTTLVFDNTIARNGAVGIYADGYDAAAQPQQYRRGHAALLVGSSGDGLAPMLQYNDFYAPTGPACTGWSPTWPAPIATSPPTRCLPVRLR